MKRVLVAAVLAALAVSAWAGEDSTGERWFGVGMAWYEHPCGLQAFDKYGHDDRPAVWRAYELTARSGAMLDPVSVKSRLCGYDRGMAKLRHVALTVPDPEKAAKFYMEAFGLKRVGETDWAGASGVYLSDGVMNIALLRYKSEEMAGHRGRGFVGVHHFGFVVEDVAAAREKVEAAGAKHWMGEPREGGGFYEVKYHDPDGIVFDLTESGWAGAEKK